MLPNTHSRLEEGGLKYLKHQLRTPLNHILGYGELLLEQIDLFPGEYRPQIEYLLQLILANGRALLSQLQLLTTGTPATSCQQISLLWIAPAQRIKEHADQLMELTAKHPPSLLSPLQDIAKISEAAKKWIDLTQSIKFQELLQAHAGASQERPPAQRVASSPNTQGNFSPCCSKVLVAEDDLDNQELLKRRLLTLGLDVTCCSNGRQAIEWLSRQPFDLLILDIAMPEMSGVEVLQWIRSQPHLQYIPVIVTSALDEIERIEQCIELGAEDYLLKPINTHLLRARLHAALEKKRLRDAEQKYLQQIYVERQRAEALLLNILPQPIAERLKQGEYPIVDIYPEATVLFADLARFTSWSATRTPQAVVEMLNHLFSNFDRIAEKYSIEKIKTIGDAYMAAAGVPQAEPHHAKHAVLAAIEFLKRFQDLNDSLHLGLKIRIGINTGSVTGGVIGQKRFIFDIWGDTVNVASRVQQMARPNSICITEATAQKLNGNFKLQLVGELRLDQSGPVKIYEVLPD